MGTGGRQRATRARTMAPGGREGRTGAEERRLLRHSSPVHDPASLVKLCPSETAAPNGSDGLLLNAVLVMRGSRGHGRWDVKEPVISSCFQGVVVVNAGQKDTHSQICFQLLCLFLKKHQNKSEKSCLHYFLFYFCHFYHSWGKIKKCQKKNGLGKFFYMQNLVIKDQLYSLTIRNSLPLKVLRQCSGCFLKTCSATDKWKGTEYIA